MPESSPQLFTDTMNTLLVVGGPAFGALFMVGLSVGAFQAATQINDPALGFIPRLAALVAVLVGFGAVMMERMSALFVSAVSGMGAS